MSRNRPTERCLRQQSFVLPIAVVPLPIKSDMILEMSLIDSQLLALAVFTRPADRIALLVQNAG